MVRKLVTRVSGVDVRNWSWKVWHAILILTLFGNNVQGLFSLTISTKYQSVYAEELATPAVSTTEPEVTQSSETETLPPTETPSAPTFTSTPEATVTFWVESSATPDEMSEPTASPSTLEIEPVQPTAMSLDLEPKARTHSYSLASANSASSTSDSNCYDDGYCVFPILSSTDDAGITPNTCTNSLSDHNIHFGFCNNGVSPIVSGFRFSGVALERNETIYEAYIEFTRDYYYGNQFTVRFDGEASPNALPFSLSSPPNNRPLISNPYALWPLTEPWTNFESTRSPNLASIVEAIIAQNNWEAGNALAFITRPSGVVVPGPCGGDANASHCYARRVFGWDRVQSGNSNFHPARLVIRLLPPDLPPSQAFAVNECPFCNNGRRVYTLGHGINAYSGNFNYQQNDGQVASVGNALSFERSYNSLTTGNHISYTLAYSDVLGYGWTHNFNVRLLLNPTNEITTTRMLIAPRGSQMRFKDNGDGTYLAFAGVEARLSRSGSEGNYSYTLTTNSQYEYIFNHDGHLLSLMTPQGHITALTYTAGKLTRITEPSGTRWLELTYNANGWIQTVTEFAYNAPTGRSANYSYTDGNLTNVTDMDGQTWTYVYDSENHLLEQIKDTGGKLVVRTVFTNAGEAIEQFDELGNRQARLEFPAGNALQRQILTTNPENGGVVTTTVTYLESAVPATVQDPQGNTTQLAFDFGLNQSQQVNALGETTQSIYQNGNLVEALDAEGQRISLKYDALNNLTEMKDARGNITTYIYNGTQLIQQTDALGNTTLYTYTTSADAPEPINLLKAQQEPNGTVTHYTYNVLGQAVRIVANYKDGVFDSNFPTEDLITTYEYDDVGRVTLTTDPQGHATHNEYNAAGQVIATTRQYRADLSPYAEGLYNLTTAYGYDAVGRVVTTTTLLGSPLARTDWMCYDGNGRVIKTVSNASGPNACDAGYVTNIDPNFDRISQTRYDVNGNVIAAIDSTGRITRTYYDALNRAVLVVDNWVWPGHQIEETTAPPFNPTSPDQNIHSETVYDAVGNVLKTIDNIGQVNHNCYDGNGRVIKTIQNPSVVDPCLDYTPNGFADQDVIQQTVYDESGNMIASIDPAGRINRTYFDVLNRPEYSVINLVGQAITVTVPPTFNPSSPTQNLVSRTYYDVDGRAYRTENLTYSPSRNDWSCFDELGRVVRTIQNAVGFATADPCSANYMLSADPAADIVTEYVYDANGQQIAMIGPDGVIMRTYYDAVGQRLAQVQNLVGQAVTVNVPPTFNPAQPTQNLQTRWGYDGLGRVVMTTVAVGSSQARTDWTCYDVLGRVIKTVSNASGANPCDANYLGSGKTDEDLISRNIYDESGNVIASVDSAGRITRTYYDDLGRPTVVVANLSGVAITDPTPPTYNPSLADQNVRQTTVYDAAGRVSRVIDNAGLMMETGYDRLGRAISVTVNVSTTQVADTTNLTTLTVYDRLGNALSRTDAEGVVTAYEYDSLNRLTAVVENYRPGFAPTVEVNVRTEYTYDARGNRLSIRDGNATLNGANAKTTFTYDVLDRQLSETDPVSNSRRFGYNKLGQSVVMTDALNQVTVFMYDAFGRLTLTDYAEGSPDVTLAYDVLGNRITMVDGTGTTTWQYDELSRPLTITSPISGAVGYRYDVLGNRTELIYPDGRRTLYVYDGLSRLLSVTPVDGPAGWAVGATTYTYNAVGQLLTTILPNGITTLNTYDSAGRLIGLDHKTVTQTLASYAYVLDAVGNRTQVIESQLANSTALTETLRASVANVTAAEATGPSATPDISDDGRVIVFQSTANNLILEDTNNEPDIFVRFLETGLTRRVSVSAGGAQANGWSDHPVISSDGRYVAFRSAADGLTTSDGPFEDVFRYDLLTREVRLVNEFDGVASNCNSDNAAISTDGRYIAFDTCADNLPAGGNGFRQVYVRDMNGAMLILASHFAGDLAVGDSFQPALSADGRFVAFTSAVSNFVEGDTNDALDVFVYDRNTAVIQRLSSSLSNGSANGSSERVALSADGRYAVFQSTANNLVVGDTNGEMDIFLRDRDTDADGIFDEAEAVSTSLVSVAVNGLPTNGPSDMPTISADGRFVGFRTLATNLVSGDTNGVADVMMADRLTGRMASLTPNANGASELPALSADGQAAAFVSAASNLVISDTNAASDIFRVPAPAFPAPAPDPGNGTGTGLLGLYFPEATFGPSYVLTRTDAYINFDWGWDSPAPEIPVDNFSIRWLGEIEAPQTGVYTFTAFASDGMRLWVNNQLLMDDWAGHGPEWRASTPITLTAGLRYPIKLEYVEYGEEAIAHLYWQNEWMPRQLVSQKALYPAVQPAPFVGIGNGLLGRYYNSPDFANGLIFTQTNAPINFDWGNGSPDATLNPDGFSVRWTGEVQAAYTDTYTFHTYSDDGVRVWVNGQLVIDDWGPHSPAWAASSPMALNAGEKYPIVVEFAETAGDALMQLHWSSLWTPRELIPASQLYPATPPAPVVGSGIGLRGDYYNDPNLGGPLTLSRVDNQVNFDWDAASPAPAVSADNFSVRWLGEVQAQYTDEYLFRTYSDDGIRVWLNGQLLVDDWGPHGPTWATSVPVTLTAGVRYSILIEFREATGGALAQLYWGSSWTPLQPVPQSQLYPAALPTPTPTPTNTPTKTPTNTPTPTRTNTPSNTPTRTNTPTLTATSQPDLIFANSFESGNTTGWTTVSNPGGSLTVTSGAALSGAFGLRANVNTATGIYVQDDTPNAEKRYRARFYFDPNTITMAGGNAHYIFVGYTGASTDVARVEFQKNTSNAYQLRLNIRNDASTWSNTAWVTITDAPHRVELDWKASTAAGANNGYINWWLDGTALTGLSAIDNDTRVIDMVRLGMVTGRDSGTTGPYFFDHFESRRSTLIGAFAPTAGKKVLGRLAARPLAEPPTPAPTQLTTLVIMYKYDALYRLKSATYSNGHFFDYAYDAVGNTLTKTTAVGGALVSTYDAANRLVQMGADAYSYDANGNLLSDGTSIYTYDAANRLKSVSGQGNTSSYQYNGFGNRVSQTINGVTTSYALDLNTGLTQVLSDGTNTYLYGAMRIGEQQPTGFAYHLGDALGSVRQLTNNQATVTLSKSYEPYGSVLTSIGAGVSAYAFTGEQYDSATGLVYLRARYYASGMGRFMTRDTWAGDAGRPMSYNKWAYTSANPINRIDPSGWCDNASYAPSAYRVQGCRENGTYFLSVNLHSNIWSRYASSNVLSPLESGQSGSSLMTVPVRRQKSLIAEGCFDGYERTQLAARTFYMNSGLDVWEINARNVMLEMVLGPTDSVIRDAIGIAYVPYNRHAQNLSKHYFNALPNEEYWQGYTDYDQPSKVQAQLELKRLLLSNSLTVTREGSVDGRIVQSWLAGLNGTGETDLEYELALIIAYGVHKRLLIDSAYGSTEYRHYPPRYNADGSPNPYDYSDKTILDNFYYCTDQTTFFYQRGSHRGKLYMAMTTRELGARNGWPEEAYLRRLWDKPYEKWVTGWPPCQTGTYPK